MYGDVAEANIWRKKNSRNVKKSGSRPNVGMKIRDQILRSLYCLNIQNLLKTVGST